MIVAGKKTSIERAHLKMAFVIEALLNKFNTMCTDEWPGGLAYKLVVLLKEEYQPKYRIAMVEMKQNVSAIKRIKYYKPENLSE